MGSLKEEFVLTNKPYPTEVRAAFPAAAAQLEALASKPPDMFEPYEVLVVRSRPGRSGIEIEDTEWGKIKVNGGELRWEETTRSKYVRGLFPGDRVHRVEHIAGADERNDEKLKDKIRAATGWRDVENVYCGGSKLDEWHFFRVHGIMAAS